MPEIDTVAAIKQGAALPLGLLPGLELTATQRRALETLEAYDLAPVKSRLLGQGTIPSTWVDEAILEFRRFLALQVIAAEPICMFSKPVDAVWHGALVHTRLYADLCDQVFGRFMHHEPGQPDDPVEAWASFERSYRQLFGPVGRLWQNWRPE